MTGRGIRKNRRLITVLICVLLIASLCIPAAVTADDSIGQDPGTETGAEEPGAETETSGEEGSGVIEQTPGISFTGALDQRLLLFEGMTVKAEVTYKMMTKKVKKKKKRVKREYRSLTKQKMYGYDTFQGAACDEKYAYQILLNKSKDKCKIAKIKVSSGKVVKVSGALSIGHGNDATYDFKRNEIVATYKRGQTRMLAIIDPVTLKLKRYQEMHFPTKIPGMSKKATKAVKGVAAIAYNKRSGQFIGRIKGGRSFIVMDRNYNVTGYIKAQSYKDYLCQTIECTDNVILHAQSPQKAGQAFNIISVYDFDGNYLATINLARSGTEIESLYRSGKTLYAGEYYSHYKTKTKTVKKKVKVRDKKGKVVRKKNGKIKYKKKKVKVKYKKFYRDNYIYKIGI